MQELTDKNFQKEIKNNKYSIVVFTTEGCGSCLLAKKYVKEVAQQFEELKLFECRVDKAPQSIKKYSVQGAPTVKLFVKGESVYTGFGVRTPTDLYYQLESFIPKPNYYEELFGDN
ncbi:thioredoxin family protein [Halothermothrix orenii]|uniref:Thioredoxin domain protein n=1 Tax=Halothermothrix orenii (strain H 168 / OCM 544 / DSM 9562) TaxID=373903 RepID=B8CY88_HALOH|nr:thioredoxin family protein [Halothermothrix orenii]ACL70257.1 Thioredoxin domain protein [Halothermothrix orenii H 168]